MATPTHRWLLWGLVAVVNVPVVVATVRTLAGGWLPLGDNGILLVRARDVGTTHNPLLGSWSSSSFVLGDHVNNPGPLYFDALALPVRLLGPWVGLAVGVMLVNMAASTLAVVAARRLGGDAVMVAVAAAVAGLQWTMGSELLFDVWQPNALILPTMAFLVLAAAVATGDTAMAPWLAGVGSLLVQTHLSLAPLVAAMVAAAALLAWRTGRHAGAPAWRRPLAWTAGVLALAWVLPVVEQFTSPSRGNLSRLAGAATEAEASIVGPTRAVRIVAEATVVRPWFTRSSYEDAVPLTPGGAPLPDTVGLVPALLVVAGLVAALVAVAVAARRARQTAVATLATVAVVALAVEVVALARSPVNPTGIAVHGMRWLWPVAALATATLVAALLVLLRAHGSWGRRALVGAAVLALAIAAANLPTYRSRSWGPVALTAELPAARDLVADLDALDERGTVLFDPVGLRYAEPYSGLVLAALQDRGVPFVFDDEVLIRQFGEGRRNRGEATLRLWQVEGPDAADPPPGAERVAYAEHDDGPVALLVEPIA